MPLDPHHAAAVGGCLQLVNPYGTLIDAKEWPYCAQATVTLKHPKSRTDRAVIEVFSKSPSTGIRVWPMPFGA
jgi:hypothetical protein